MVYLNFSGITVQLDTRKIVPEQKSASFYILSLS